MVLEYGFLLEVPLLADPILENFVLSRILGIVRHDHANLLGSPATSTSNVFVLGLFVKLEDIAFTGVIINVEYMEHNVHQTFNHSNTPMSRIHVDVEIDGVAVCILAV